MRRIRLNFEGHSQMMETERSADSRAGRWRPNPYLATLGAVVVILLVVVVCLILTMDIVDPAQDPERDAIECPGLTKEDCERKGCRYAKATIGPSCTMEKNAFGYEVREVTEEEDGVTVRLAGLASDTPYGPSLSDVTFRVTYLTENIVRFQFKDAGADRYEVPVQAEFPLLRNKSSGDTGNLSYLVTHSGQSEVFNFAINRTDGTTLWDSSIGALLLSDKYLQIGSYLATENVYGLGEHSHDTLSHSMDFVTWPMFARDEPPQVPTNGKNLYGVHPFYTCLEKSGKSHGVFFLNSNAMEVTLMPAPAISFRTVGGILDFFMFVGDNPEHVIQLYTSLIGRPMLPPYWGLGFQLSKYGYKTIDELRRVMDRNWKAKIPQTVQYLDIDHLQDSMDFTYDNDTFAGLPDFIDTMKDERGLKWVIIQEPVIAVTSDHYDSGVKRSVFVKRSPDWKIDMFPDIDDVREVDATLGKVWPSSYVVFLDFFLNETSKWWKEQLLEHQKTIHFDGIWIDMNEPANFGTNEDSPIYCKDPKMQGPCWALKCPDGPHDTPPYNPFGNEMLSHKTLCMQSVQGEGERYLHYNVHSLYGWSQTQPTVQAAQEATGSRSLVISRSTYPSSGRYAGHWLGDNFSDLGHMQKSIIGMLEFNMFGIPYIGADVCGFGGDAKAELCKIWMQLGAFYPYYRNHNAIDQQHQDPAWYPGGVVADASRRAIERRIRLNPYLYTLFYKAHVQGDTVVRPLFHEFPDEEETWDLATQFMWGKSIMVAPILKEHENAVPVYFPKDDWWLFKETSSVWREYQQRYVIETDAKDNIPMYVRGGTILPYGSYDWDNYPEKSDTRNVTLYVFHKDGRASGDLFMDDGLSVDTVENGAYAFYEFEYSDCSLKVSADERDGFNGTFPYLERVVIFDVPGFANLTAGDYEAEAREDCQCAIVNVLQNMKDVEEFTWQDSKGECPE